MALYTIQDPNEDKLKYIATATTAQRASQIVHELHEQDEESGVKKEKKMELNGKKFNSFDSLGKEFEKECLQISCETCEFNVKGEGRTMCFAKWLNKYFEADQAADEAMAAILSDFVMKPKEQIEKETKRVEEEVANEIKKVFGDDSLLKRLRKAVEKRFDEAMKDQEEKNRASKAELHQEGK